METSLNTLEVDSLPLNLPSYSQILCNYDVERRALWYYINQSKLCSTQTLVAEVQDLQNRVAAYLKTSPTACDSLHYLVVASAVPQVFNLGGDLELFRKLISARDRDTLYQYARAGVEIVYGNWKNLGVPSLTTISLVQGMALGGGFEGALSSNVLVAEEGAKMGFPEILFNLFPGMGAYSLLSRRIEAVRAERLLRSGRQCSGRELWDMGVVDVISPNGEGVHAVNDFIRRRRHSRNGQLAIQQARQRVNPLTLDELIDVVEIWVETAMRLSARDLRVMEQLSVAQGHLDVRENQARPRPFRNDTTATAATETKVSALAAV
jgi:DSF synthase